jgi:Chaperone of endosialidase
VYVEDVVASSVVCDPRVKKNVNPLKLNATQTLKQIRPVNFYYKDISIYRDDGKNHIGFLADNLADVLPESVKGIPNAVTPEGEIQPVGVDTTAIIAVLVKAIQELSGRVDNLERVSHTK